MTREQLKTDFCKRFNETAPQLKFTHCGILCTLLGSAERGRSLSCALSMGVDCAARRTSGGYIRIERTDSNVCLRIRPEKLDIPFPKSFNGADILLHSSIIGGYDEKYPLRAALTRSLLRLIRKSDIDPYAAAAMCEGGRNTQIYNALLRAKRPYCTFIDSGRAEYYPLPVTGTLFICISTDAKPPRKNGALSKSDERTERLMIDEARLALKGCRFERFADIINSASAADIRYARLRREQRLLIETVLGTDGCICAHAFGNSIWALAESELTDNIIGRAKSHFQSEFGYIPPVAVTKAG